MDNVFKNGPRKIFNFKFFKGCHPQILLGPFLNTLSHIMVSSLKNVLRDKNAKPGERDKKLAKRR